MRPATTPKDKADRGMLRPGPLLQLLVVAPEAQSAATVVNPKESWIDTFVGIVARGTLNIPVEQTHTGQAGRIVQRRVRRVQRRIVGKIYRMVVA